MFPVLNQLRGLAALRSMWFFLYLLKAIIALLVSIPFFVTVDSILSSSIFGRSLLQTWDMSVFVELFSIKGDAVAPLLMTVFIGAIIYIILMQFINGGLYYAVVSRKFGQTSRRDFFAECGANIGTHIKITLIMMIVYALLIPAGMFFLNIISFAGGNIMGTPALLFALFRLLIMLIILTAASIYSDSARAAAAAHPDKGLKEILRQGSAFYKPRLMRMLLAYTITYLPFIMIWLVVEWLALNVTGGFGGMIGIIIEFILFQIAAVSRVGQKLWFLLFFGHEYHSVDPGRFLPEQTELKFEV